MDEQYMQDGQATPQQVQPNQGAEMIAQAPAQPTMPTDGPRKMTFLTLVLKTFAGFAGGIAGTLVLLLIFLPASAILQPIVGAAVAADTAASEPSPLFMVVLMSMIFATCIVSSMLSTLLLAYTERDRYTRIATTMSQVFFVNIVIFAFVLPIYLTTSTTRLELTVFAAVMQVILSSMASALILELIHDRRYSLLAVYTTILGVLVSMGINFFIYFATGTATAMMFAALPIIWATIGFSQAALTMFYFWMFETWGSDFLANTTSFGADYGVPDTSEEEEEEERQSQKPDVEGGNFLKQ